MRPAGGIQSLCRHRQAVIILQLAHFSTGYCQTVKCMSIYFHCSSKILPPAISTRHTDNRNWGDNHKSFWKDKRKNTIVDQENKSWNRKIKKEKKTFTKESKEANSYRYSLSGKNSYSFFSFDATPPKKRQQTGVDSKEKHHSKHKSNKKRRKLKVESRRRVEGVKRRSEAAEKAGKADKADKAEEAKESPLYTYSLSDKASRSHAYFWSGVSQSKQSSALHESEGGVVRLDTGADSQPARARTTNILAELRTNLVNFQHQSKLLTKIFLCKISQRFEFC